ncbi:hypothetical protein JCM3774_001924 [Rhodotorula dairenensis]
MARSVESSPLLRGEQPARATTTTPESGSPTSAGAAPPTGIRAVNPSPAPAKRLLRLSTRALTPSQQRSLAYAIVKEPAGVETSSSSSAAAVIEPTVAVKRLGPLSSSLSRAPGTPAMTRKKSRRIASEPMLSKLYASRRAERVVVVSPPADDGSGRRRTSFDFERATALALSHEPSSSPRHAHTTKRRPASSPAVAAASRNNQKKTRTPRKDPAAAGASTKPHPHSLVKSMLGLAARTVKAFSTAQGRKRFLFGKQQQQQQQQKRPSAGDPEWVDDGPCEAVSEPQALAEVKVSPSPTKLVRKRLRVSDESTRSRLAREEAVEAARSTGPKTPRAGSTRHRAGAKLASSSTKHPSSGGGASTFRAPSSRKRVRVSHGRRAPSLVGKTVLTATAACSFSPSSVLSTSRVLNRARPVPRSEALLGEYKARALLRSSVTRGHDQLGSSTRSKYEATKSEEETEGEEWVLDEDGAFEVDEFGAPVPTLGGTATLFGNVETFKVSRLAAHVGEQDTRNRFYRSLAPSPISTRTVTRKASGSRPVSPPIPSARRTSVLSLHELSHLAVVDDSHLLDDDDDSASSPLTAFVRQLATAQSSSRDGDVEESSDSGVESPGTATTTDSEARRRSAVRLPQRLPFSELARSRSSSPSTAEAAAEEGASPFEDAPDEEEADFEAGALGLPRQVDSADLASARVVVDAKRLSRELVRTGSLAVFNKRRSDSSSAAGGIVSAPVSPTVEDGGPVHNPNPSAELRVQLAGNESLLPLAAVPSASSSSSSRLPSLSPVSPFKFHFSGQQQQQQPGSCEYVVTHSPTAVDDDVWDETTTTMPPHAPRIAEDEEAPLHKNYRELTRRSADFPLPPAHVYSAASAALREKALEVFRFPATAPEPGAGPEHSYVREEGSSSSTGLRRTIRPGGGGGGGGGGTERGRLDGNARQQEQQQEVGPPTWQVYRDDEVVHALKLEDTGDLLGAGAERAEGQVDAGRSDAAREAVEAGVLVERTEASMLRKMIDDPGAGGSSPYDDVAEGRGQRC